MDDELGVDGHPLLYQIICLQNTPPLRSEEQDLCMRTRKVCWRLTSEAKRVAKDGFGAADDRGAEAAS